MLSDEGRLCDRIRRTLPCSGALVLLAAAGVGIALSAMDGWVRPLARQCDISTGTVIWARIERVTPPRTSSRIREWP